MPEGHDEYAVGKRHCERVLRAHPEFPSTAVRVPPVMGPEDWTLRFWILLQRVLDGSEIPLPDGGTNVTRLVYSEDLAQAFVDILDEPKTIGKTYNVAQKEIMTMRLLVERIAAAAGREPVLVPVPRSLFDRAGLPFGGLKWCQDGGLLCDGSPHGWREIVSRISSDLDAFLRKRGVQSCSHRTHARRDGTRLLPSQDQSAHVEVSNAERVRELGKSRVPPQARPTRQRKEAGRRHAQSQRVRLVVESS